jgi:hypothetical protein
MDTVDTIKGYFTMLKNGDYDTLQALFLEEPLVNTPMDGEIHGKDEFKQFVNDQKQWFIKNNAKSELINMIIGKERVVSEFIIYLTHEGKQIDIPLAFVAELRNNLVNDIRIYHSTWPLTGKHLGRKQILEPAEHLEEPEIIQKYMNGIKKPDKELVLSLFEEDAYVREPSGFHYKHEGYAGRNEFYSFALEKGGIPLKHCTATYNGRSFAVEYVFDEWGDVKFEPEAGIAVYDIGKSGKISAVRIYDDASPPGE